MSPFDTRPRSHAHLSPFTSGFVGLNTPAGLSFQIHACTIQLVSAVNRPPRDVHCASLNWTDALLSGRTHTLLCLCQLASVFGNGGVIGRPSAPAGAGGGALSPAR